MADLAATPERLDFRTKFFYGFGSVSFGVKDNGFSYMLLLLFVRFSYNVLYHWLA